MVSSGKVYHPAWCNSVGNVSDENPKRLLVVEVINVGARQARDDPFKPEPASYPPLSIFWPEASRSFLA